LYPKTSPRHSIDHLDWENSEETGGNLGQRNQYSDTHHNSDYDSDFGQHSPARVRSSVCKNTNWNRLLQLSKSTMDAALSRGVGNELEAILSHVQSMILTGEFANNSNEVLKRASVLFRTAETQSGLPTVVRTIGHPQVNRLPSTGEPMRSSQRSRRKTCRFCSEISHNISNCPRLLSYGIICTRVDFLQKVSVLPLKLNSELPITGISSQTKIVVVLARGVDFFEATCYIGDGHKSHSADKVRLQKNELFNWMQNVDVENPRSRPTRYIAIQRENMRLPGIPHSPPRRSQIPIESSEPIQEGRSRNDIPFAEGKANESPESQEILGQGGVSSLSLQIVEATESEGKEESEEGPSGVLEKEHLETSRSSRGKRQRKAPSRMDL